MREVWATTDDAENFLDYCLFPAGAVIISAPVQTLSNYAWAVHRFLEVAAAIAPSVAVQQRMHVRCFRASVSFAGALSRASAASAKASTHARICAVVEPVDADFQAQWVYPWGYLPATQRRSEVRIEVFLL